MVPTTWAQITRSQFQKFRRPSVLLMWKSAMCDVRHRTIAYRIFQCFHRSPPSRVSLLRCAIVVPSHDRIIAFSLYVFRYVLIANVESCDVRLSHYRNVANRICIICVPPCVIAKVEYCDVRSPHHRTVAYLFDRKLCYSAISHIAISAIAMADYDVVPTRNSRQC